MSFSLDVPFVSCVCVTRAGRDASLAFAIDAYAKQTYPNRELVIVTHAANHRDASVTLGAARAFSGPAPRVSLYGLKFRDPSAGAHAGVLYSRGEYLAAWDDDDRKSPTYLEAMVAACADTGRAVAPAAAWVLFRKSRTAAHVVLRGGGTGSPAESCFGSGLVMPRKLWPYGAAGPNPWAAVTDSLAYAKGRLSAVVRRGVWLAVGAESDPPNARGPEFHHGLAARAAPAAEVLAARATLEPELREAVAGLPGPWAVLGQDGEAFTLESVP